ncbi:MAG: cyclodeaminase/cyclohydrolase family protein [Chloroflexota bacterium]|nr:cyclodeaminase/cyclohydrolase family protein [Chloroflexota bacterium]
MDGTHHEAGADSLARLTLLDFSERLASADPVPGGGSASAVAASLAASLLAMVARLSLDRPKYEAYRETNERALEFADASRRRLLELAQEDARAYAGFVAARRLAKETEAEQATRERATKDAARQAAEAPLAALRECAALMDHISSIAGRSNLNAASDLEVAARLCAAAARGAAANVRINLPAAADARFTGVTTAELEGLLHGIEREVLQVSQRVARGVLRGPEDR